MRSSSVLGGGRLKERADHRRRWLAVPQVSDRAAGLMTLSFGHAVMDSYMDNQDRTRAG